MRQEAFEVEAALQKSGEDGPYILVGHSLGGLVMRVFATRFPDETAGIVLVDATSPDTTLSLNGKLVHMRDLAQKRPVPDVQTMQSGPPHPPSDEELKQWADFQKQVGEPKIEPPFDQLPSEFQKMQLWAMSRPPRAASGDTYLAEELEEMWEQISTTPVLFGDKPLVSIIAGRSDPAPPGADKELWFALVAEKIAQKRAYADLSRNSKAIVDAKAGHHVHLDDPDTVASAIHDVVTAINAHSKLAAQ